MNHGQPRVGATADWNQGWWIHVHIYKTLPCLRHWLIHCSLAMSAPIGGGDGLPLHHVAVDRNLWMEVLIQEMFQWEGFMPPGESYRVLHKLRMQLVDCLLMHSLQSMRRLLPI